MNYNGRVWMDRNLGATSGSSYGLYYQWGRKDPFPGGINNSYTINATYGNYPATMTYGFGTVSLTYSIQNPNIYYTSYSDPYSYNWLSPQRSDLWYNSGKTIYDPCPDGWHIPLNTNFSGIFSSNNTFSGYWADCGSFGSAGSSGWWWSGVAHSTHAYCFVSDGNVYDGYCSNGFAVRCIKN
jgi:hypothetical protein